MFCLQIDENSLDNFDKLSSTEILQIATVGCDLLLTYMESEIPYKFPSMYQDIRDAIQMFEMILGCLKNPFKQDGSKRIILAKGTRLRRGSTMSARINSLKTDWALFNLSFFQIVNLLTTIIISAILFVKIRINSLEEFEMVEWYYKDCKIILHEINSHLNCCLNENHALIKLDNLFLYMTIKENEINITDAILA